MGAGLIGGSPSGPPFGWGLLALLLLLPCASPPPPAPGFCEAVRVPWRSVLRGPGRGAAVPRGRTWPRSWSRVGWGWDRVFPSPGLYAGIKFFLIDFIFKRCPRLRAKYDTPYIIWRSLPTAAQGAFQRRRVSPGRPGSGRGSQAPPLAAPRARGGQRLSRGTVGLWGFPCRPAPLFRTAHEPRGWRPPPAAGPLRAPPTDLSQEGPRVKGRRSTGCWSRLPRAWGPWEEGPLGAAVQAFRSPALRLRPTSCPHAGTGPVLVHGGRRLWGLGPASQVGAQRTSWPRCSPPSRMRGGRSGSRGGLGSLPEGGDLDFWVLCVSAL